MANPGCMKYTRIAPKRTQMVSTEEYRPSGSAARATDGRATAARSKGHLPFSASIFLIIIHSFDLVGKEKSDRNGGFF